MSVYAFWEEKTQWTSASPHTPHSPATPVVEQSSAPGLPLTLDSILAIWYQGTLLGQLQWLVKHRDGASFLCCYENEVGREEICEWPFEGQAISILRDVVAQSQNKESQARGASTWALKCHWGHGNVTENAGSCSKLHFSDSSQRELQIIAMRRDWLKLCSPSQTECLKQSRC